MSGLVLNVSADPIGLEQINKVITRLETVLNEPVSANFSELSAQLSALDKAIVETDTGLSKLQSDTATLTAEMAGLSEVAVATQAALAETSASATGASAKVDLLTGSLSTYAKTSLEANLGLSETGALLTTQANAAALLTDQMAALTVEQRTTLASSQAIVLVQDKLNQGAALSAELAAIELEANTPLVAIIDAENAASAALLLSKGLITEARYNEIAGIVKESAVIDLLTKDIVEEVAAVNLLTISYSEFVSTSLGFAGGAAALTAELQMQGKAAAGLLASMAALSPEMRAVFTQEQGAVGVMSAANKEMALQAELIGLMAVGQSEYVATLRAETIALAKLAVIKGAINQERYNEIAGLTATTAARVKDTAAIEASNVAAKRASASAANLNGAMRGAAGATGTLWLSYGAILPLLATFATVMGTIKGYKSAADFEYTTKYIEALGDATGDATANLEDMQRGLIGIKGVAQGPTELADGLKVLVKAGFSAKESLGELPTLARLATVAEEDLATTTSAVISQYRAWNVENVGAERGVRSMAEAANVLAYAALSTTLDIKGLLGMMKFTTVLASQSAASFIEVTAALGVMSDMGIKQTTAATSLRTALIQLQTPTSATIKLMNKLDLNPKIFKDDGGLKNLPDMFYALSKSLRTLPDSKRIKVLNSLFSIRAITGGATMLDHLERVRDLVAELETVKEETAFVDNMYKDLAKTTKVLWEETKASWERAGLQALDTGAIKELIQMAKDYADSGALTATAEGIGGTVSAIATTTGATVDALGLLASPLQNLWNSAGQVSMSISDMQITLFGATSQFLAAQKATEIYGKQLEGTTRLTLAERNAAESLTVAYGSVSVAARAEPFDKKLSAVNSAIASLEGKAKLAEKEVKLLRYLQTEKAKLLNQKQAAVDQPSVALASLEKELNLSKELKQMQKDAKISTATTTISPDVNAKLAAIALKERDSQAKYELRTLKELQRAKLIASEDYRKQAYDIDLARLKDKAQVLSLEKAVAEDNFTTAVDRVGDDVYASPKDAQKAVDSARIARAKATSAVNMNNKSQERLTAEYIARTTTIRLTAEREYAKASLEIVSKRSHSEKTIVTELVSEQMQELDNLHAAGIVKDGEYLDEKRKLQEVALRAEATDLKNQLSVLEAKKHQAMSMPETKGTAVQVVKLQESIEGIHSALEGVDHKKDALHGLVLTEDMIRAKELSDTIKEIEKSSQRKSDEVDFNIRNQSLGDNRQALESARRGNRLERDDKISSLVEQEGTGAKTFAKVDAIMSAYDDVDAATIASFEKQLKASEDFFGGAEKGANDYAEATQDIFSHTADLVSGAFKSMEDAMVEFAMTGKLSFTDFANSIISDMMRIMVQQSITGPLASAFSSGLTNLFSSTGGNTSYIGTPTYTTGAGMGPALANGGAFVEGRLQPFATGGIVNSPTIFPFADGTGLMGEAGPEAIMPLTRINGRLGVDASAAASGDTNVIVNNYGDAQNADVEQKRNASGGTDIVVTLEKELSNRIRNRGSRLSQTLEATYGFKRVGGR